MRGTWSIFRLLSAIVSCAAAALVVVQAPTILLFQVALVASMLLFSSVVGANAEYRDGWEHRERHRFRGRSRL